MQRLLYWQMQGCMDRQRKKNMALYSKAHAPIEAQCASVRRLSVSHAHRLTIILQRETRFQTINSLSNVGQTAGCLHVRRKIEQELDGRTADRVANSSERVPGRRFKPACKANKT